jgi:hypothetical protein
MRTRRKWTWRAAAGVTELTDGSQMLPASRVREKGRPGGGLCPEKQTALVRYAARNENSVRVAREPDNGAGIVGPPRGRA